MKQIRSTSCEHRLPKGNKLGLGKVRYLLCKKDAPRFYYFNGRDTISLCAICAEDFRNLNLTVQEIKNDDSLETT